MRQKSYYFGTVKDPIGDAIATMVGRRPPLALLPRGTFSTTEIADCTALQDWVCSQLGRRRVRMHWSTGIGVLDAADAIVAEAVGNANIAPKTEMP